MVKFAVQYLTNEEGEKIAVQLPIAQWEQFLAEYQHLSEYQSLKSGIQEAMQEWQAIKRGEKKAISLSEFLNTD
jgi:hypothetical protein